MGGRGMTPVRCWQVWPSGLEIENRVSPLSCSYLAILWRNMNDPSCARLGRALKIEYDNGQTIIVRAKKGATK